MNLNKVKQWLKNKVSDDAGLIERLTKNNQELYAEQQKALLDLNHHKKLLKGSRVYCDNLERQSEGKRIALIFVTTLLLVSLFGNAIQFFNF